MLDLFLLIFFICRCKIQVLNYITFVIYILLLKYFNFSFYLYQNLLLLGLSCFQKEISKMLM